MGKPSARLKLMYVEGDEEVLKEHTLTIEKAGHHVTSIVGRKDAMEQLKTAPKEEVAPARIERANVLLGLATTAGATIDPRVAESVR